MTRTLRKLVNSKTFADLNIVFIDSILSRGISLVLFLLIARTLGPEGYGIYSLITVSILFLVSFFDFGMENIAVRFSGRYHDERESIFGVYCLSKAGISIVLILVILLFPDVFSKLLNKPMAQKYLLIIFIGFVLESYRSIIATYYQSIEKYFLRGINNVGTFLLRLVTIFILLQFSDNIEMISLVFAVCSLPVVLFFIYKFISFFRVLLRSKIEKSILLEIAAYSKWTFLAAIAIQLMSRLDFYVVTRFSSFEQVGLYHSASQLVSFFSFIPFVFGTVFLPKASKYNDSGEMRHILKSMILAGIPITILVIGIIPFSEHLISFTLGGKYLDSIPIFQVLVIAFLFAMWTSMLGTFFYSSGNVKYITYGAYIQLTSFVVGVLIFTPQFGISGILWSKVAANAAYLILVVIIFFHKIYPLVKKSV